MWFNTPLAVTRYSQGQYDQNGVWHEGATSTVYIGASIQPTSPNDIKALPEGRRDTLSYTLYSAQPLYISNDRTGQNADTIDIAGDTFEAVASMPWQNRIISHYKTIVCLRND